MRNAAVDAKPTTDLPNAGRETGVPPLSPCSGIDAARKKLMEALDEYTALIPPTPKNTAKPRIVPTLRHASPSVFTPGYNMLLDAGGYMPGKIPVVAIPARPQDLKRYRVEGYTVKRLLKLLLLDSPNMEIRGTASGPHLQRGH
jgi:hypothetical protein